MGKPVRSRRRFAIGAEVFRNGVHFRVWAPGRKTVEVVLQGSPDRTLPLRSERNGYFSGLLAKVKPGDRYKFRLDRQSVYPDPASRFQPEGPFGYSQVVDSNYAWTDARWKGLPLAGQVIYEMHIGTFTPEGTWASATVQLGELAALGITVLEVMPVADFPGRFGWGYDGVNLFAPTWLYGTPADFRAFVDTAHQHGMAVILDVVYNHLGPDGNFLPQFSADYFSKTYSTDWGEAINFDGDNSGPVREYFLTNAAYWMEEFHLDGLRVDATQNIYDAGEPHILQELAQVVRRSGGARQTIVIAENEPQDSRIVRPTATGGFAFDGMWNDDFHHSAMVALTGRNEAYYTDYEGTPQEFIAAAKHGFLYQGQYYSWQKQRRGKSALDLDPSVFITFIQNHDQIANSVRGVRAGELSSPGRLRALTTLLLLMPGTPMLFQGQEFGASSPFFYFSDHKPEIAKLVVQGRADFLAQFASVGKALATPSLSDPCNPATFEQCKLDLSERTLHAEIYALHKDLIRLRREHATLRSSRKPSARTRRTDGAVLSSHTFVLRYFGVGGDDRLLLVNLGVDFQPRIVPEPLLAPPADREWQVLFSTEEQKYGGNGVYPLEQGGQWHIPGESAVVLAPAAITSAEAPEASPARKRRKPRRA